MGIPGENFERLQLLDMKIQDWVGPFWAVCGMDAAEELTGKYLQCARKGPTRFWIAQNSEKNFYLRPPSLLFKIARPLGLVPNTN